MAEKDFEEFMNDKDKLMTSATKEYLDKISGMDIPDDIGLFATVIEAAVEALEDCGYPCCYPYHVYDEGNNYVNGMPCCDYDDCRTRNMYPELCFKKDK